MLRLMLSGLILVVGLIGGTAYGQSVVEPARDEAKIAGRTPELLNAADEDYFAAMDHGIKLSEAEVRGRNTWNVWTSGNDRFWDYMEGSSFGAFDLLKILSSYPGVGYCTENQNGRHDNKYEGTSSTGSENAPSKMDEKQCRDAGKTWVAIDRDIRWRYYGLVNEPCFDKAKSADLTGSACGLISALPRRPIARQTLSRMKQGPGQDGAGRVLLRLRLRNSRPPPFPKSRLRRAGQKRLGCDKILQDLKNLPENPTDDDARKAFRNAVPDLLELSKCPDFIANKGHYFGSNLSDADKNALIEFLKTL